MLDRLLEVLGNSHFEAYIGGPIAGALASLLFAAFGNHSSSNLSNQSPRDIYLAITHQYNSARVNGQPPVPNNGDGSVLVFAVLIFFATCFLFAAYLPQVSFALCFFITTVATFSVASCLLGWFSGQFNTIEWWQQTIFPFFVSLGSLAVAVKAEQAISVDVVSLAQGLLQSEHFTMRHFLNAAIAFYKDINNEYMQWLGYQMLAFILVLLSALGAFLQCIHFISLANARSGDNDIWAKLVLRTIRFRGMRSILATATLLLLAWLCASGEIYRFFHT